MKRYYRDYVNDIFESMKEIGEFIEGMDFEQFKSFLGEFAQIFPANYGVYASKFSVPPWI